MVQALIKIKDSTNRFLNVVKAKHGLKDKSEAIEFVVRQYVKSGDEPDMNPAFVKQVLKAEKQEAIRVDNFAKRYEI